MPSYNDDPIGPRLDTSLPLDGVARIGSNALEALAKEHGYIDGADLMAFQKVRSGTVPVVFDETPPPVVQEPAPTADGPPVA